jgi:AcrR family transcriptional regulator
MAAIEKRENEREYRRRQIIEAAKRVFFAQGFRSTTMDMVAKEAALAKGTLYLYFNTKEELYISLVEEGFILLHDRFAKLPKRGLTFEDFMWAMMDSYIQFTIEHPDLFGVVTVLNSAEMPKSVRDDVIDRLREKELYMLADITKMIEKAQRDGELTTEIPTKEMLAMIWAATTGALTMCQTAKQSLILENIDTRSLMRLTIQTIIKGCRPKENNNTH